MLMNHWSRFDYTKIGVPFPWVPGESIVGDYVTEADGEFDFRGIAFYHVDLSCDAVSSQAGCLNSIVADVFCSYIAELISAKEREVEA